MRPLSVSIVFLLLVCIWTPSKVQADGNQLLQNCNSALRYMDGGANQGADVVQAPYCVGQITAVKDLMIMITNDSPSSDYSLCLPSYGIGNDQLIRIVVQYLKNNPSYLHYPSVWHIKNSLRSAFPCE